MIAPKTAKPVRSQNSSTYSGSASSTTSRASAAASWSRRPARDVELDGRSARAGRSSMVVVSDTSHLPSSEESGWSDQEHGNHDDIRHHVAEPPSQEGDL